MRGAYPSLTDARSRGSVGVVMRSGCVKDEGDYIEVARLVAEKRPLPVMYRGLHEVLKRRMPAANMFIALLEGPDGIRFPYYVDQIEPEDQLRVYAKAGLTAHVLDSGSLIWVGRDPGILDRIEYIGPRPSDWIGIPLVDRSGSAFGALTVQTYEAGEAYDEDDLRFLEFSAAELALAVQLQRLDRDIAIERIAALVDETTELDELYPRLHAIVASLIPVAERSFVIARIDEDAGRFRPVYWRDERDDWGSVDWPLDRGMSGYICRVTGESFIYEEGRTPLPPDFTKIGANPRFWLGAPLRNGDRIVGVVFTQSYEADIPITRDDEATLVSICPHLAQAIGRLEFFELNYRASLRP